VIKITYLEVFSTGKWYLFLHLYFEGSGHKGSKLVFANFRENKDFQH